MVQILENKFCRRSRKGSGSVQMCFRLFPHHSALLILTSLALINSGASGYRDGVPNRQICSWSSEESLLECNVRTLGSDFWNNSFSGEERVRARGLRLRCNDKLLFESFLPGKDNGNLFLLEKLESLSIESCKLRRLNSEQWLNLRFLKSLSIQSHNGDWSSSIGLELNSDTFQGAPTSLQSLDLSFNNIWTLPSPFLCPHLTSLLTLNLSKNGLSELPEEVGDGPRYSSNRESYCPLRLVNLDISGNRVRKIGRNGISRLRTLVQLRLQNNYIEELEDSAFSGLTQLRLLNLSTNRLVALPPTLLSSNTNIRELYLQNNSLSALSPQVFSGLENLQLLDLSRNSLSSIWVKESLFTSLIRLVVLKLSHNQLSYIDPVLFSDLISLQALHLDNNQIENINPEAFRALRNLHLLDLSRNRLSFVDSRLFSTTFILRQLYLDHNRIRTLDADSLKNCTSLQDLGLAGNILHEVPTALRTGLSSLSTLDIGENRIVELSNESFAGLGQLYGLRLVDNRVSEVPPGFCESLKKLRVLNLAQNRIKKISESSFIGCPELRALRLDTNVLEELPATLSPQLPSLLWLNVSENRIKWADYHLLPPTIEWLDLSHNALESLGGISQGPALTFHLRVLDASHNELTELDSSTIPPTLETLRLNHNKLKLVAPDTFSRSIRLRRVELTGNQLETLPLSSLRFPAFPITNPLPEAYLGGNPFLCDCAMEWLTRINQLTLLRQHPRIMDLESIVCKTTTSRTTALIPVPDAKPANFLCPYKSHCSELCQCCEFEACDCAMTCPGNCSCSHDSSWSSNIVECSDLGYSEIPERIPMDATEIYLDGNQIPVLGSHIFIGKRNLRLLFLNGSGLEEIRNKSFNGLKSLETLRLDSNLLSQLKGFEFTDTPNLRQLYLQNNRISSIASHTFSRLKFLQVLRLDGNLLIDFNVWELSGNGYLNSVMVAGNPWSCDCEFLVPFRTWVDSKTGVVVDFSMAKCQEGNVVAPSNENESTELGLGIAISSMCSTLEDNTYNYKGLEAHEDNKIGIGGGGAERREEVKSPNPSTRDGSDAINFLPLDLDSSSNVLWTVLPLTSALLILLIAILLIFRKRLYDWCSFRGLKRPGCLSKGFTHPGDPESDCEKLFDAYFLYCPSDEELLSQKILPELDRSLRLCLHRDLVQNLENPWNPEMVRSAAEASKRVIILLSSPFLQSGGGNNTDFRRTLQTTLSRHSRKVVLILLVPLTEQSLPPLSALYPELKTVTALEWGQSPFWTKFRKLIPAPTLRNYSLQRQRPPNAESEWPYTNFAAKSVSHDLWSHPHHQSHGDPRRMVPVPPYQPHLLHPLISPFPNHHSHHHHQHEHQNSVSTISNTYRPLTEQNFSDSSNTLGGSSNDEELDHVYSTLDSPLNSPPTRSPANNSADSGVSSNPNGSGPMYFV